jgi:hypothetical protein
MERLSSSLVTLSLVTDPFGQYNEDLLHRYFRDIVRPFKYHFVTDLSQSLTSFVSKSHVRNMSKAFKQVHVQKCLKPSSFIQEWTCLYSTLVQRHSISGIAAFSKRSFAGQFSVPGMHAFRATRAKETVGMLLWYRQGDVGYYHLGAFSPLGYELGASFALFWFAMEWLAGAGVRWLDLGAGAGLSRDRADGLSRFKNGWSTGRKVAYFCGCIFDRAKYSELVELSSNPRTTYFPAYRNGEFGHARNK